MEKKSIAPIILAGLTFITAAVLLFLAKDDIVDYVKSDSEYKALEDEFVNKGGEQGDGMDYKPYTGEGIIDGFSVDFSKLKEINPDIVGWIYLPGSKLSYPIVKGEDNVKYLNTSFRGEKSSSGTIFMHSECASDFSSKNTLIYGHNMKNGTMFRPIRAYEKEDFYKENPYIYIFTPVFDMKCRVVSAFTTNPESFIYQTSFDGPESYEKFMKQIFDNALYTCKGGDDSNVITLSTCTGPSGQKRFIVILQPEDKIFHRDDGNVPLEGDGS